MKQLYKTVLLLVGIGMAVLGSVSAGAITREDMLKLNAAYPPGSVVSCETRLEGNGKNIRPMLLKTRGHIKKRTEKLSQADVSTVFIPQGSSTVTMTVNYQQRATMEEDGELVDIDPDSLTVSFSAANPAAEAVVAKKMRDILPPSGSDLRPYETAKITVFPAYTISPPGQPPIYCHKEK